MPDILAILATIYGVVGVCFFLFFLVISGGNFILALGAGAFWPMAIVSIIVHEASSKDHPTQPGQQKMD